MRQNPNFKVSYGRKIPLTLNGPFQKSQTGFSGDRLCKPIDRNQTEEVETTKKERRTSGCWGRNQFGESGCESPDPFPPDIDRRAKRSLQTPHNEMELLKRTQQWKVNTPAFCCLPATLWLSIYFLVRSHKVPITNWWKTSIAVNSIGSLPPPRMLMFEGLYGNPRRDPTYSRCGLHNLFHIDQLFAGGSNCG